MGTLSAMPKLAKEKLTPEQAARREKYVKQILENLYKRPIKEQRVKPVVRDEKLGRDDRDR